MARGGMRVSEVLSLTPNDVDARRLIIRDSKGGRGEDIVKLVDEEKIDLVVIGTHGRKGLERTLFGSVAEHVVKNASAPVLTINPYKTRK